MSPDDDPTQPPQRATVPLAHAGTSLNPADARAEQPVEEGWLAEDTAELPRRPRRRLLTPLPLSLLAVLLAALGFIGGVLVEKGQGAPSSSASASASAGGQSSALSARFRAARGTGGLAAGAAGGAAASARGGFTRPTVGTLAYLQGSTLYVTTAEGDTVKVTTSAATGVSKDAKSSVSAIHPGETVTITGSSGPTGAVSAESITVGSSGGLGGLFDGRSRPTGAEGAGPALFGSG